MGRRSSKMKTVLDRQAGEVTPKGTTRSKSKRKQLPRGKSKWARLPGAQSGKISEQKKNFKASSGMTLSIMV